SVAREVQPDVGGGPKGQRPAPAPDPGAERRAGRLKRRASLLVEADHDVGPPRHFFQDPARQTLIVRDEVRDLIVAHHARSIAAFAGQTLAQLALLLYPPVPHHLEARRP